MTTEPSGTPLKGTETWAEPIASAFERTEGARFYRCALQVNPFEYVVRHKVPTSFTTEVDYNAAIVAACKKNGVEVIGITDHYRIRSAASLIEAAQAAGLHVFPGFEASSKEAVHFLCLFEPGRSLDEIDRLIGDCGIHDDGDDSPVGRHDCMELIEECNANWGGVCIAAHVCSKNGLLKTLHGQAAINAWRHEHLLACALPGPPAEAPEEFRLTLLNKNADYRRERRLAVLNCQDVSDPSDLEKPAASCWVKMTGVTCEALRQAFLDPESRIRLASDPEPEDHTEFLAIAWEGGFLDGLKLRLSENLNALIGGRGTGKSTVIESLRYVLGKAPSGEETRKQHEEFVKHVLRSGTKVSLLVRSHTPSSREYLIERTVPNAPVVRDKPDSVAPLSPEDVLPETEVYGQHEISELTRSPERLTLLLNRFVQQDSTLEGRIEAARQRLEETRSTITSVETQLSRAETKLEALPALEEKLKRYQDLGVEEKLKDRSHLVKEQQKLDTADRLVSSFDEKVASLQDELPLDTSFLDEEALSELPGAPTLKKALPVIQAFSTEAEKLLQAIRDLAAAKSSELSDVRTEWSARRDAVQAEYQKILRELQKDNIDGEEFIKLQEEITELKPLAKTRGDLEKELRDAIADRRSAVTDWENLKAEQFRALEKAAKRVSKQLAERVRVTVSFAGNRQPLRDHIQSLPGRTSEMANMLLAREDLSLSDLVTAARAGKEALTKAYPMPAAQAELLCSAGSNHLLQLEELDLPATTTIHLNVAAEGAPPVWRTLDQLSTGQKATAVLLLLLLESEGPLVVDQPEDDLDNRFISEGVVPAMRREKRRRQFVFATHNANIPVLGDAELIITLSATGEAEGGHAEVPDTNLGSIDCANMQDIVKEILEGGPTAFETRRRKYGF